MIKLNTNYEFYLDVMNVCYIESHDTLLVDSEDGHVEVNGVSADQMVRLARNLFCARDSITNHTKDSETTKCYAKEIVMCLERYLNESEDQTVPH